MTESEYRERFKELIPQSPLGAEALRYAYGSKLYLLPLAVGGKEPLASLVPNGLRDASNDPEQILDWWTQEPNANIGFVPGLNSLLGIDVDGPAGRESLRKLQEELGELPETWHVRTGREEGGEHFYFRVPAAYNIKNLNDWREGIDLKHKGGYLILPPSVHLSGKRYCFVKRPLTLKHKAAVLPKSWYGALPLLATPATVRRETTVQESIVADKTESPLARAHRLVREAQGNTMSRPSHLREWLSFADVKDRARGKWDRLLNYLWPGFTESAPNYDRYDTCPVCGKAWKFKLFRDFNDTGTCICYGCHEKAGDGIATLAWLLNCSQDESRRLLCDLLQTDLMK